MMADKMNCTNDEDMIRMAFRVLDKDGSGTISSKTFKHLMTHIGKYETFSVQTLRNFFVKSQINFPSSIPQKHFPCNP